MCRFGLVLDHLLVLNTEDCSAMQPKVRMEKNSPPVTLFGEGEFEIYLAFCAWGST